MKFDCSAWFFDCRGTSLLAKAFGLRHIGDAGEVAEWLKAAVC
jgi:hypothetical protein